MKTGLLDLLFSPDAFFKTIVEEKPDLVPPLIIVTAGCAVSLAATLVPLVISIIYGMIYGNPFPLTKMMLVPFAWTLIKCEILGPFLAWIFLAGILYLISRLFSRDGSFPAVLQNTGYGLVPWVISRTITVVAVSFLIPRPEYYMTNLLLNPATVTALLFYLFLIWCCVLWVFALKHTCLITVRRAAGVVLLGIIICFIPLYLVSYFPFSF